MKNRVVPTGLSCSHASPTAFSQHRRWPFGVLIQLAYSLIGIVLRGFHVLTNVFFQTFDQFIRVILRLVFARVTSSTVAIITEGSAFSSTSAVLLTAIHRFTDCRRPDPSARSGL